MNTVKTETPAVYKVNKKTVDDDAVIAKALEILAKRMKLPDTFLTCPNDAIDYLRLTLAERKSEHFGALFLNNNHGVIEYRELFHGTINATTIHARELVRAAIDTNAAAVVITHNHPSGTNEPSAEDVKITELLKNILAVIDVRLLDHIIIAGNDYYSMASN